MRSIFNFYWNFCVLYILGIVITACLPIHKNDNTFEGVACVDMLMRDLISNLTALPNLNVGYTLMLDSAGNHAIFLFWIAFIKLGQLVEFNWNDSTLTEGYCKLFCVFILQLDILWLMISRLGVQVAHTSFWFRVFCHLIVDLDEFNIENNSNESVEIEYIGKDQKFNSNSRWIL